MLLIYVDESGNTWEKLNDFFKDGPYVLHTGILINQEKYFHLERLFYDLFSSILGIKDWQVVELHASDIWKREGYFKKFSESIVRKYFAEFLQMLAKFSIKVVIGLQQKDKFITSVASQIKQVRYSQYALLHGLEHSLAEINETGVIISDAGDKIKSLSDLLYKRSQWRYNPGADRRRIRDLPGFRYETRSCFILDQMHFVSSKDSFFVQIVDHVSYVFQRVLTYSYLKAFPQKNIIPRMEDVPVTKDNFTFFVKDVRVAEYKLGLKDVSFSNLVDICLFNRRAADEYLPLGFMRDISPYDENKRKEKIGV